MKSATLRDISKVDFVSVKFQDRVLLDGSSRIGFRGCSLQAAGDGAALEIFGQRKDSQGVSSFATHHVTVADSVLKGGGRTVFVLGAFESSDKWNHSLLFSNNDISCGSKACFQISGGRNIDIRGNRLRSRGALGVLTAGANGVRITRNRFSGNSEGAAIQIATPGWQWDPFRGVENMISSNNVVANNIVSNWGIGIMFAAARDTDVVFNTFANVDLSLFMLNHKPLAPNGQVLVEKSEGSRVWNNVLTGVLTLEGEDRPTFESHNFYTTPGAGAGAVFFEGNPMLGPDYTPLANSVVRDMGTVVPGAPTDDFAGRPRDSRPDIGAAEFVSAQ